MSNINRRIAKIEATLDPDRDQKGMTIIFLAETEDGEEFESFARKTYGFGRYVVIRFVEADRALADMPPNALAFEAGGKVLR